MNIICKSFKNWHFSFICIALFCSLFTFAGGNDAATNNGKKKFNISEMIFHHILDSHEFHIFGDLSLPLPCIMYCTDGENKGLNIFMSSKLEHGKKTHNGFHYDHGTVVRKDDTKYYDLSITKNVFMMLFVCIILFLIFRRIANRYKNNKGLAPKGIQSFFEPLIIFIRDDIAKENIGEKHYMRFFPYIMALFFFILALNLFGLIPFFPGSANVTGNIAVTAVLALITAILTNVNGNKHYWQHLFNMPGVPGFVKLILTPIELLGAFIIKPGSLMIRLFANITAGHIIILSLVGLIFLFSSVDGYAGESIGGGTAGAFLAVPFVLFMNAIELLVAFLQAYIFAMLSALYIGQAVEEPHHH